MVSRGGVAESKKSCKNIVSANETEFPALVPVTEKLKGLEVVADRPLTVKVVLWPIKMPGEGANEHLAPLVQDKSMVEVKLLGPEAETVKVV